LETALKAASLPVPDPVDGAMLVDTGADSTCIAKDVALELGLQAVDVRKGLGAGGEHENTIYAAKLTIQIDKEKGRRSSAWVTIGAAGIPRLREQFEARDVTINGEPLRLIGLLGRDLLSFARITYQGTRGIVDYSFDFEPLRST
jgi:hypothetical protein